MSWGRLFCGFIRAQQRRRPNSVLVMCLGSPASATRLIAAAHHMFTIDSRREHAAATRPASKCAQGRGGYRNRRMPIRSGDSWARVGPRAIRQPAKERSKESIFGYDESLMYQLSSWPIVFPGRSRLIVYPWSSLSMAPHQHEPREAEQPQLNSIGSSRGESAMSGVP